MSQSNRSFFQIIGKISDLIGGIFYEPCCVRDCRQSCGDAEWGTWASRSEVRAVSEREPAILPTGACRPSGHVTSGWTSGTILNKNLNIGKFSSVKLFDISTLIYVHKCNLHYAVRNYYNLKCAYINIISY